MNLRNIKTWYCRQRIDPDEARREELEQRALARKGGAVANRVLPG
jgi:hypothetical protein